MTVVRITIAGAKALIHSNEGYFTWNQQRHRIIVVKDLKEFFIKLS